MLKVLFYAIPIVLTIYAIIDCLQTPAEQLRGLPRLGWLALIVLLAPIGGVVWLIVGRARDGVARPRLGWPAGPEAGTSGQQRPTRRFSAPDDDPEFLSQLGRDHPGQGKSEQDALLEQWEQDLRRRESDLRGDSGDSAPGDGPPDEGGPETGGSPAPRV
jgi:hypothetical protein